MCAERSRAGRLVPSVIAATVDKMALDAIALGLVFVTVLFACVAQMTTGFGFNLVLVPLVLLRVTPADAIVLAAVLGSALTTVVSVRERAHVAWGIAGQLLAAGVVGLPIGIVIAGSLAPRGLTWFMATVLVASLVVVSTGVKIANRPALTAVTGLLSGTLLTSTGMNGPPLVALLRASGLEPRRYRATLALLLAGPGWVAFGALAATGRIPAGAWSLIACGLAAMPLGAWLGERLFARLDARRMRLAIVAVLALSLVMVLVRS